MKNLMFALILTGLAAPMVHAEDDLETMRSAAYDDFYGSQSGFSDVSINAPAGAEKISPDEGAPSDSGFNMGSITNGIKTFLPPIAITGIFAVIGFFIGGPIGALIGGGIGAAYYLYKNG